MTGQESSRARIADLGGLVEVGPGRVRLGTCTTTFPFRAPELLSGQNQASGALWLRADVWALGITMAQVCGLDFFKVGSARIKPDEEKLLHNKLRLMVGTSKGAV